MNTGLHFRDATREDLQAVAHIHVKGWRLACASQIPPEILEAVDIDQHQNNLEELFGAEGTGMILACMGERRIGFIWFGPARDERMNGTGEIYAVYLAREAIKKGVGWQLFKKAMDILINKSGFPMVYLWILDSDSAALSAFKRWGGEIEELFGRTKELPEGDFTEAMVKFYPEVLQPDKTAPR